MPKSTSYRVVRLTPNVPAAIATIAVEGPDVADWISQHVELSRPLNEIGRIHYGLWAIQLTSDATQQEQVVVCLRSNTLVEVSSHGGSAVVRTIMNDLCAAGAQEAGSLTARDRKSRIEQAAEAALLKATTDQAAGILLDQLGGSLSRALEGIRATVAEGDVASASTCIDTLLTHRRFGLHLSSPWRIVLAGPPNVGKSSLINSVIGTRRSIVHDQPGTTRDWVEAETSLGGWPVSITDTAGIRHASESIEQQGIQLAGEQIDTADIVVLVVDSTAGWQTTHDVIVGRSSLAEQDLLIAWNKVDDLDSKPSQVPNKSIKNAAEHNVRLSNIRIVETSCEAAPGTAPLTGALIDMITSDQPGSGDAVPFAPFIADELTAIHREIQSNRPVQAQELLDRLLSNTHDI